MTLTWSLPQVGTIDRCTTRRFRYSYWIRFGWSKRCQRVRALANGRSGERAEDAWERGIRANRTYFFIWQPVSHSSMVPNVHQSPAHSPIVRPNSVTLQPNRFNEGRRSISLVLRFPQTLQVRKCPCGSQCRKLSGTSIYFSSWTLPPLSHIHCLRSVRQPDYTYET